MPHHGSRSSLLPEFYERVRPKIALVAAGFGNYYGFPHLEVVEFCRQQGISLFTTAQSGELSVSWKGTGDLSIWSCNALKTDKVQD